MASLVLLLALAASVSNIAPEVVCRSVQANALPDERANAFENCVSEERAAQQKVDKTWAKVRAEARVACAPMKGIPFSYVAVMTCLNMQPGGDFDPTKTK